MNQIATTDRSTMNSVAISTGANGSSLAPQSLAEVVRFAEVMCRADIALPKHLRGNAGACMAVAMQALEWQMSPFAVASKSYAVNGAIAYEAQLIAAVVNTRSGIKGRLKYTFEGSGPDMTCTVTGMLDGEECSYTSPPIGQIPTKNSPLWKADPQQQLGYFSARSWARRHCPEVILGVYDRDEAQQFQGPDNAKDVTPSVMQRLQAKQTGTALSEGFNADFVSQQTDALAGQNEHETSSEAPSSDEQGSGDQAPEEAAADPSASNGDEGEPGALEDDRGDQSASGSPDPVKAELMRECIDNMIRAATDADKAKREERTSASYSAWLKELPDDEAFVKRVFETSCRLIEDPSNVDKARQYLMAKVA